MKKIIVTMLCVMGCSVLTNAQMIGNGVSSSGIGQGAESALLYGIFHPESLGQSEKSAELAFAQKARLYCIAAGNSSFADKEKADRLFGEMKAYLEEGGNVNARDVLGNTALHFAAQSNNLDLANLLFEYKIEAKVKNKDGRTPLHIARKEGYRDFAIALVQYDPELPEIMYVSPK